MAEPAAERANLSPSSPDGPSRNRSYDAVFLDAGGVLVSPHPGQITDRFAAAGFEIDPVLLLEAHYRGVLAIDDAGAEPEVFDDYHLAYARHLGLDQDRSAEATAVLQGLWGQSALWAEPLPGAAEGLAAIAATGVAIVVVSNADGTVADLLSRGGWRPRWRAGGRPG